MQKAWEYGKKNLLILFDFEFFLNYVHRLTILIAYPFDAKNIFRQLH